MKAFEDMTDTRVYNWEVGYERYDFSYEFKYKDPIYEHPTDYHRDIFPENLCGKLLFRYINNNIMPYIIKGKYFSTSGKYIDGKYKYRHKYSRVMFDYGDNCPLTGMCYDYYLLKPIIDYYNAWCTYPEDFSLEDLMRQFMITSSSHGMRSTSIGLIMKMRYVRSFIIISMKIDSIMRMGMCMLNH